MDLLSTLFHQQSRKIGILVPSVVVSERHSDALEITEHPVEKPTKTGAGFVADHAFRRPSEVVMEVGFAGGGSLLDLLDTSKIGISAGMSPREVYESLLKMQRDRELLDITTGKKKYGNMLLRVIDVTTDKHTEYVLSANLTFREMIITSTATVQVSDKKDMELGADTSATQNAGVKAPAPKNESILSKIKGAASSFLGVLS